MDLDRIEDPDDSLDADSQELEAYGCLFNLATAELHPDLEALLGIPLGQHVVIAERARVAPAWRGCGGVGRYLTGRLFRHMCCDPVVIATYRSRSTIARDQNGRADEAALKPALRQIQRTWQSIGFQPRKGDIWILDPGSNAHQRAMTKLAWLTAAADKAAGADDQLRVSPHAIATRCARDRRTYLVCDAVAQPRRRTAGASQ